MNKQAELIERAQELVGGGNYMFPDEEDCMRDLITEIQRLDGVVERLGSNNNFTDVRNYEEYAQHLEAEIEANVQYAREHRSAK